MRSRHLLCGRTAGGQAGAAAPRRGRLTLAIAAALLGSIGPVGAGLTQPAPTGSAGARLVFDYTSIALTTPPLADPVLASSLAFATHVLEPLIDEGAGARELRLPVAWRTESASPPLLDGADSGELPAPPTTDQIVVLDAATSRALQAALPAGEVTNRLAGHIRARATEAGHDIALVAAEVEARILERERLPTDVARGGLAAWMRVLTRGEVHDRWTIREELIEEPAAPGGVTEQDAPDSAFVRNPLVPERLLQVDVVAAGLHEEHSGYPLPGSFLHVALRMRLWHVRSGRREWDRQVILGSALPSTASAGQVDSPSVGSPDWQESVRSAASGLFDSAAALLVADLAGSPPPAIAALGTGARAVAMQARPAEPATAGAGAVEAATPLAFPDQLKRLAQARLQGGEGGDAWRSLRQAVEPGLPHHLGIALACAEDPSAALAGLAARQMGIGLAEAHRVVAESDALRRVLASELTREVSAPDALDEPGPVAAITAHLLAVGAPGGQAVAPDAKTLAAARALLATALAERAESAQALAGLLLAGKVLPEEASTTIAILLRDGQAAP